MERPAAGAAPIGNTRSDIAQATRDAGLLSSVGIVVGLAGLVFNVEIARVAGPAVYGEVGPLLALATVAGFLAAGINYTVARSVVSRPGAPRQLLVRTRGALWPGAIAIGVLLAGAIPLQAFLHASSIVTVLIAIALFSTIVLSAGPGGILLGLRRFGVIASFQAGSAALRLILGSILTRGPGAAAGALVASLIPPFLLAAGMFATVYALPRSGAVPPLPLAEASATKLGEETITGAILAGAVWGTWILPQVFARHYLGAREAGIFAASQVLATGVLYLTGPFTQAFFPTIARRPSRQTVLAGLGGNAAIGLLLAAAMGVGGPLIMHYAYGGEYDGSHELFITLGVSAMTVGIGSYVLWASRATQQLVRFSAVAIISALLIEIGVGVTLHGSSMSLALGPGCAMVGGATVAALLVRPWRRAPASVGS